MKRTAPTLEVVEWSRRSHWLRALMFCLVFVTSWTLAPASAGSLPSGMSEDPIPNGFVVSRVIGPALLDAARGSSFCPSGWEDMGSFDLTAYVLAHETEFSGGAEVTAPCGLEQTYYEAFLYGDGVRMQGSGRARDGSIVHWAGNSCFEVVRCPLAANGRCATSGRTVAVDPSVIPLGTELLIEGLGRRRAEDTGGWIRGHHIDVYYGEDLTYAQAMGMSRPDRRVCRKITEKSG